MVGTSLQSGAGAPPPKVSGPFRAFEARTFRNVEGNDRASGFTTPGGMGRYPWYHVTVGVEGDIRAQDTRDPTVSLEVLLISGASAVERRGGVFS
jgi:hypothetical protein